MNPRRKTADAQGAFNFEPGGSDEGHSRWLEGRRVTTGELARRLGLPLGHRVEVWLVGGIRLTGLLRLREELLFIEEDRVRHLELMVDNVSFTLRELESCVRL